MEFMNEIKHTDRHLIATMAATIAGPMLAASLSEGVGSGKGVDGDIFKVMANMAVGQALEILISVKIRTRCGECENCKLLPGSKRCSQIPGEES